jgi:dipeptidyl aminopeptidase/acylaminoacyl peptidase
VTERRIDGVADGKVSFLGIYADAPDESGLQVIYVDWATKTSTPADSLIPVGPCEYPDNANPRLRVEYCWNPGGTSIVYGNTIDTQGLLRIDETGGWSPTEIHSADGDDLHWSPDGSQIAFVRNNYTPPIAFNETWKTDIEVVAPDGSWNEILVAHTGKTGAKDPRWSPSGSHLVYTHLEGNPRFITWQESDIYRVTSSGGDPTNLTSDSSLKLYTISWLND